MSEPSPKPMPLSTRCLLLAVAGLLWIDAVIARRREARRPHHEQSTPV